MSWKRTKPILVRTTLVDLISTLSQIANIIVFKGEREMSVILKRHVEARITKLEKRLQSQDPEVVRTEIKELTTARDVVSSKRLRNSLENQIQKLKLSMKDLNPKPIQDELAIWKSVTELMNGNADYNKRRRTKK